MDEQRLADYLADELDPDERAALEARLAGDPTLRRRLERMRAADEALASLSTPPPRPGFEDRLHDALAPEVERLVGGGGPGGDELAARRAWSSSRRRTWPLALGGVAAGLALLAVVGLALTGLPSTQQDAEVALDDAGGDGAGLESAPVPGEGPRVLASDRDLDDDEVRALLEEPSLVALARRDLEGERGRRLAERYEARFADEETLRSLEDSGAAVSGSGQAGTAASRDDAGGDEGAGDATDQAGADAERPADEAAPTPESAEPTSEAGRPIPVPLDEDARADLRRCLPTLLDEGPSPVPAYAEVAAYGGEPVVVFGLLAPGADGRRYDRLEVWVLDRDDCEVRAFRQRDTD